MSNVFTLCENCNAQFPHQLLSKCEACGSESVYCDTELTKDEDYGEEEIKRNTEDMLQVLFY